MGYTHYWDRTKPISDAKWKKICKDVRALLEDRKGQPPLLAWDSDQPQSPPEISDQMIRFNGIGDEGHETFLFERSIPDPDSGFIFCKTARKPYDLVVCATLAVIADHAPYCGRFSSDGEVLDWISGVRWASNALGRVIGVPKGVRP